MNWYTWLVFLHVLASFGFVLAHGVGAVVALRLPHERALDRLRAMLELSEATKPGVHASLLLILATGTILGFMGSWWRMGWIWTSLLLLVGVTAWMGRTAEQLYAPLKKAVGLPYRVGFQEHPPEDPKRPEEIAAILREMRPLPLCLIGYGAIIVIVALMVLKPF